MLKAIKHWLKLRKDKLLQEEQQKLLSKYLLSQYSLITCQIIRLTENEKNKLAAIFVGEEYKELLKVFESVKNQLIQQSFHGKFTEEDQLRRQGGVIALQMVEVAMRDIHNATNNRIAEEVEKRYHLDGLGW